ncbi:MAG: UMP kinase [Nitrososphaeria archaeon]
MQRVVIKLSGSVFKQPFDSNYIKSLCESFISMLNDGIQPIIVSGGGEIARSYINIMRALGADETTLDEIGISVSRLNAKIIISALGDYAYPLVPTSMDEISLALTSGKIVVLGGLYPGHSTNATAALVAEKSNAFVFINATDVDGVYTADPKVDKNAKKYDQIDTKTLFNLVTSSPIIAGSYDLFDPLAIKIIERSKIRTKIILCTPQNILNSIKGVSVGTEIVIK